MMDPNKFRHDVSRYERPNRKFRCGRAAEWEKPCEFGPDNRGGCGGVSECQPAKVGDRHECRRSAMFGGPCDSGPLPDGSCANQRPPCQPRRTIRNLRGLMSISAFAIIIAVIAMLLTFGSDGSTRDTITSAGPLSGGHENFTSSTGCIACHEPHDKDPGSWFMAAFEETDISYKCLDCHTFGGDPVLPHNTSFVQSKNSQMQTSCISCHTEHKGENFNIATISDASCNSCHEIKIDSFGANHPQFAQNFPHDRRTSIRFNHTSHINKHFQDQRMKNLAPDNCTSCHNVDSAQEAVMPKGFDESCSSCHVDSISRRELVLLRLPEFEENLIDQEILTETCGPTTERWETIQESINSDGIVELDDETLQEDYEAVSVDEPTAASTYLLRTIMDDPAEYGEPIQELILTLTEDGPVALTEAIEEISGEGSASQMLAGLSPELVKRVACAWAANTEYEAPSDPEYGGWYGEGVELRYKPLGHADPVIRSWINFGVSSYLDKDDDIQDSAEAMRIDFLDKSEGIGACIKCHAISDDNIKGLSVEWKYKSKKPRNFTFYSHKAHINLLNPSGINLADPEAGCQTCHKIDAKADFEGYFEQTDPKSFESNFSSIGKETCTQCHNDGQVRQDCQLCHIYHLEPGFNLRATKHE